MLPKSKAQERNDLAETFLLAFPLAENPLEPVKVTLSALDQWAIDNGHYAGIDTSNSDSMNMARGKLRRRINWAGSHEDWITDGNEPFQLDLKSHPRRAHNQDGIYHLKRAGIALADASIVLPGKMVDAMTIRKHQIEERMRMAGPKLQPMVKMQGDMLIRSIDNWAARVGLDAKLLEGECFAFYKSLMSTPAGLLGSDAA